MVFVFSFGQDLHASAVSAHSYSMVDRSLPVILTCQRTEKIKIKDPLNLVKMPHFHLSAPQIWVYEGAEVQ